MALPSPEESVIRGELSNKTYDMQSTIDSLSDILGAIRCATTTELTHRQVEEDKARLKIQATRLRSCRSWNSLRVVLKDIINSYANDLNKTGA